MKPCIIFIGERYTHHSDADYSGVDASLGVLLDGGEQLLLVIDRVHSGAQVRQEDDPTRAVGVFD